MRRDPYPCPAGCGRSTSTVLCAACWREVPKDLRDQVLAASRAYRADPTDARWFAYVDVRESAIDAAKAVRL